MSDESYVPVAAKYDRKWHSRVDHTLFGFMNDDSNIWVDGLLQNLADMRRLESIFIKIGLPLIATGVISVFLNMVHNYKLVNTFSEALGHFAKGYLK